MAKKIKDKGKKFPDKQGNSQLGYINHPKQKQRIN